MAFIDVVTWDGSLDQFVWKFPSDNLRFGTQLVVKPGQCAIFVKAGKVLDEFGEGTVTLQSGNLPLLTSLMGLPFGGRTPFQAEVWFVNRLSKLNNRFGTPAPIQIEDPKYGLIVPVRAFGQFGFRVREPKLFLETLVGTARVFGAEKISEYFRGRLLANVNTNIGGAMVQGNISVVHLATRLDALSQYCLEKIAGEFSRYGLELVNFYFESINVPETDPSYIRLKQIKEKAAELNIIGRDIYQYDKSMDVLKTAAGNEGAGSGLMQSGIGLGMGVMVGSKLGQQAGQMVTNLTDQASAPPPMAPSPQVAQYYVALNGQQLGPLPFAILQQMVLAATLTASSSVWRQGMAGWSLAASVPELAGLFNHGSPPPPPMTERSIPPPI